LLKLRLFLQAVLPNFKATRPGSKGETAARANLAGKLIT
jgi:hypothetical protein